ncbi:D-alanyl-D-alanine carboxypeptidase [Pleurocapsa sp. CCALA 161]|uniref:D-alanyl-D-alanine carboxypeptidase n=1 Tax=Pleurocapsa sp. CCALA 161 TaxID=2107688 RepID=UPI001E61DD93|nr:D-alanyl-D-alanine carboxypeptidase [Pleurocapsa sp. CCALA 161]
MVLLSLITMLDLLVLSVTSVTTWFNWFNPFPPGKADLQPLEFFPWEQSAVFKLPEFNRDRLSQTIVDNYLQKLTQQGFNRDRQGIWVQSGWDISASNLGKIPLPAASLSKIATTLTALSEWGANHQFTTDVYFTGEINHGVVTGDLIIQGTGDPLFVWEEAIALGNALNQLGIKEILGNILVTDKFYMNFESQSVTAGKLLQQALNQSLWSSEISQQYQQMPIGTKHPEVITKGQVKQIKQLPINAQLLINHRSLPLAEILRQMNIYSNNQMAQMLADLLGGADIIAQSAAKIAGFPQAEIKLVNGSGLGEENKISPRAVCQMLMAIDRLLQQHDSDLANIADLFPTASKDFVGTVKDRGLPKGTTIKTGTLDNVSAIAGVIPTSDRLYFSIINYGRPVNYLRQQQDNLLNQLVQPWQLIPNNFNLTQKNNWDLGNPQRNQLNTLN